MKLLKHFAVAIALTLGSVTYARSEKAHVHGSGEVSIAFDGLKGQIVFESPADSTVGFEHAAKSPSDKKKVSETLDLIKSKITEMIIFKGDLKCRFSPSKVEFEQDKKAGHAETHSEFNVICDQSPQGSLLEFNFSGIFPKLHTIDVQIIVDDIQKSLKVTPTTRQIELKP